MDDERTRLGAESSDPMSGSFTGWHIEIMRDLWSGRWSDSDAAFVFGGVYLAVLFFVMFSFRDIVYVAGFVWDLVKQPIYGGSLLLCMARVFWRRRRAAI